MTAPEFLSNFGDVANAPGGVARLRELVFQLAATGLITVRDNGEEDVQALISKLTKVRRNLVDRGDIKSNALLPAVDLSRPMPTVPSHWSWIRLGNLASKIGSGSTPRGGSQVYVSRGVPFLRSQNVWNDGIRLDEVVCIDPETHEGMRNTQVLPDDILLNITGASLGRCAIVPSDFPTANVSQHVTIIRPLMADTRHFIRICLLSPYGQQMIWGRQVGMAREGLSKKVLEQFEIPLPPLAEQMRIVAKVDELMALCDQLEAQQQERERRFPVLSRTCHARFAEDPSRANLSRIFDKTGTVSPNDLRRSIVNIAIQGRLVRQLDQDEAVDVLLARCDAERAKNGRSSPDEVALGESVHGRIIPETWRWKKLDDLLIAGPTNGISPEAVEHETVTKSLTLSATTSGQFKGEHSKFIELEVPPDSDLWLRHGDILVQRGNSMEYVGVAAVYMGEENQYVYPDLMMRCRFASELDVRFIHLVMNQDDSRDFLRARATGTSGSMPKINQTTLKSLPIPVPPVAEQRRIVAKVDELMALVNQLEAQQQERDKLAEAFAKACIASFTGTTQLESPKSMKAPKTEPDHENQNSANTAHCPLPTDH